MKLTMWLLLSGILIATALPVGAAPLGVHGLKAASAATPVGGYYRHHGYWNWHYPRYSRRHYRYYDEPYYYRYAQPYYPYYYRPYRHYRHHYGPTFGFYYGGHRRWRGHW